MSGDQIPALRGGGGMLKLQFDWYITLMTTEGEGRLWLVWLVSKALPTVLSLEDKDLSASTFAPQFGQKANDDSKPPLQLQQNILDRSKMASIYELCGKQRDQALMAF